jgi:hypothetical protein
MCIKLITASVDFKDEKRKKVSLRFSSVINHANFELFFPIVETEEKKFRQSAINHNQSTNQIYC